METKTHNRRDVYSIVTDRIIAQLEKGIVPWKKPWTEAGLPQNFATKRPYRGINVWLLSMLGFERNFFITANQLKEIGGSVKKGEKSLIVIYWNWREVSDEDSGEKKQVSFLRYYAVFNVDQCEGLPDEFMPAIPKIIDPIGKCEEIIEGMPNKPTIKHKDKKAFYNPLLDVVNMPKMNAFDSSESYYDIFFHELAHSTGHPSRLNRKELVEMAEFGSEPYSIEELTAEMGSCYLQSLCALGKTFENSAAYIQGWLNKLKDNRQFVIYAAAKAQHAVDYILNVQVKEKEKEPEPVVEQSNEKEDSDLPF